MSNQYSQEMLESVVDFFRAKRGFNDRLIAECLLDMTAYFMKRYKENIPAHEIPDARVFSEQQKSYKIHEILMYRLQKNLNAIEFVDFDGQEITNTKEEKDTKDRVAFYHPTRKRIQVSLQQKARNDRHYLNQLPKEIVESKSFQKATMKHIIIHELLHAGSDIYTGKSTVGNWGFSKYNEKTNSIENDEIDETVTDVLAADIAGLTEIVRHSSYFKKNGVKVNKAEADETVICRGTALSGYMDNHNAIEFLRHTTKCDLIKGYIVNPVDYPAKFDKEYTREGDKSKFNVFDFLNPGHSPFESISRQLGKNVKDPRTSKRMQKVFLENFSKRMTGCESFTAEEIVKSSKTINHLGQFLTYTIDRNPKTTASRREYINKHGNINHNDLFNRSNVEIKNLCRNGFFIMEPHVEKFLEIKSSLDKQIYKHKSEISSDDLPEYLRKVNLKKLGTANVFTPIGLNANSVMGK